MSKSNYHMDHVSAEQMEYYLAGVLSRREMHTIERHLLDCEFCNEAMDGFEASSADIGNDVAKLSQQLNSKVGVTETKTITEPAPSKGTYRHYGIAAVIALLLVSIYFVFNLQKDSVTIVAQSEGPSEQTELPVSDSTSIAFNDLKEDSQELKEEAPSISKAKEPDETLVAQNQTVAPALEEPVPEEADTTIFEEPELEVITLQAVEETARSAGAGGESVTEVQDLAFAEEDEGDFEVNFDTEEEPQPTIVLSQPSEDFIEEDIQTEALRKRQASSPAGIERSAKSTISPVGRKDAEPELGLVKYLEALQLDMKYPDEAFRQGVQGQVELSFTVESNGELSNIRVVKSLGSGCDEEAIRLVTDGPAWAPSLSNGAPIAQETQITIEFKLDN